MKVLKILALMLSLVFLSRYTLNLNPDEEAQGEVPKIIIVMEKTTEILEDSSMVIDKINEYIRPLISAEIDILYIEDSVYGKNLNYMFDAAEQVDVVFLPYLDNVKRFQSSGKLLPLDQLMSQYGDGILENIIPDEMSIGKINDRLYGIPTNRSKGYVYGFQYRKDIAERYGIDISDVEKLEDLTPIFESLKKSNPEMRPFVPPFYARTWDGLDDYYYPFGVLMDYGQTTEVVNLYETKEYANYIQLMYEWNQAGYMVNTTLNYSHDYHYYLRSDEVFCRLNTDSPGMLEQESRILGKQLGYVALSPVFTCSVDLTYALWSVTSSCKHPDKAMQFLNLMYSDPVIANLLYNGIEGEHYEFVDQSKGIIDLPEGVDSDSARYMQSNGWKFGNQFITYVWGGNSPDLYSDTKQYNAESLKSKALGFSFDTSPVYEEYMDCINVKSKYAHGLEIGVLNPRIYLPKLLDELDKAGIDIIISEKQRQLDDWLKDKNTMEADH